jgi:hypothetical protein
MSLTYQLSSLDHVQSGTNCNGTIATKLETDYGVCLKRGFVCPVEAKPLLAQTSHPFDIKDVDAVMYDPTRGAAFLGVHGPMDPIFCVNIAEDAMHAADIISGRSCLRALMAVVSPEVSDAYYSKRKAFTLLVEKNGRKLILKTETNYPEGRGGLGQGFEDVMTTPSVLGVDISGMDYFRVVSYTLGGMRFLTSHEVDCVHPINGLSVELKSSKIKRNKRGAIYNLTPDYYINVWRQMVLSGTPILKIGRHENGAVKAEPTTMTIDEVRSAARIAPAAADLYFARLVEVLRWISSNVADGQQALIEYMEGGRALDMKSLSSEQRLPCLSQSVLDKLSPPPLQQPLQPAALVPACDTGPDAPLPLPPHSAAAASATPAGAPSDATKPCTPPPVTSVTHTSTAAASAAAPAPAAAVLVDELTSEGSEAEVNALADLVKKVL